MDGVRAHAELAGDHAERSTASDGSDHGPTAGGLTVSLVMVHLSRGRRFPSSLPAERSGCSVTQVFGMLCHLPPEAEPEPDDPPGHLLIVGREDDRSWSARG